MAQGHKQKRLSSKGFTLVELIVTVAILAFGIVAVYEALFISVDAFGFYAHYLDTQDWIDEKIWDVQRELTESQTLKAESTSGQIVRGHKTFDWVMAVSLLDDQQGLYQVDITLSWEEGGRRKKISRETYLLPPQLRVYHEEGSA